MTYQEYLQIAGVYNPDNTFDIEITQATGIDFKEIFHGRFDDREIFTDNTAKFGKFLKNYVSLNIRHYVPMLTAEAEAAALVAGNLTHKVTGYAAPSGAPDTAYTTGFSTDEVQNDKSDIAKLTDFTEKMTDTYIMLLASFEPLFVGVF